MGNHKVNWKDIPWKKFHRHIYRLQKRIFKASQRGDVGTMRRLQKLLMKSFAAKCLAVRRVTQDNQGKSTAGVDGIKSLTPKQRLELVETLKLGTKARATRRVMIPKPGKAEKRPRPAFGGPATLTEFPQCMTERFKVWSNKPWNQSGKQSLSPTPTGSDLEGHVMMLSDKST